MAQFYFALVGAGETSFAAAHKREDAGWIRAAIDWIEGGFATLEITVKNPRVGLLAPGRNQWAWFAWDDGATTYPLFFGRLDAVPANMHREAVDLTFTARPGDFEAQKAALAASLKARPFWDPVFVRPEDRSDPDFAWEARSSIWHIDRVTHTVTDTSILVGEDGTLVIADFDYDALEIDPGGDPVSRVDVVLEVFWGQLAQGEVDLSGAILDAFQAAGSGDGWTIHSLTSEGLIRTWFEDGRRIGSGWSVAPDGASLTRADGVFAEAEESDVVLQSGDVATFPVGKTRPVLVAAYEAARTYSERLTLTVRADVQAVKADSGSERPAAPVPARGPVDEALAEEGGQMAIGDVRRRAYFPTERGRQSVEFGIALGRARLARAARAATITAVCPWRPEYLAVSGRKSATIAHDRIPGGGATGKVTGYRLLCEAGRQSVAITIGCMVGKGNSIAAAAGGPAWVEDGWVESGWQMRDGEIVTPVADIGYPTGWAATPPNDDGIDFFNGMTAAAMVEEVTVAGALPEQQAVAGDTWGSLSEALAAVNQVHTQVCVSLKPLQGGPFETAYAVGTLDLMVARGIDLEA